MEKHVWFDFYWIFLLETKRKETGDLYFLKKKKTQTKSREKKWKSQA
jgi:hypothetical protein